VLLLLRRPARRPAVTEPTRTLVRS
jgi:hypothetical protein